MKRILFFAALILGVVSCQKDANGLDASANGEASVTLNVSLSEVATRAAGADSAKGGLANVDLSKYDIRYILEVYDKDGNLAKERMVNCSDEDTTSFTLRLIPGRTYSFVVWADFINAYDAQGNALDLHYDTSNGLKNIAVIDAQWDAIDESRDAYTDVQTIEKFNSSSKVEMKLTRPFAKLRVVTNDIKELFGVLPTEVTVQYYNTNIYNTFNALDKTASGKQTNKELTVTLWDETEGDVDVYSGGLDAEDGVQTLFADYLLGAEDDRVMFTFDAEFDGVTEDFPQIAFNTNIPVKRNHLTTIYGPILTDYNNVTVTIDANFDNGTEWNPSNDEFDIAIWDGESVKEPVKDSEGNYIIKLPSELAWLADQVNGVTRAAANDFKGETFKLAQDIDLGGERWTPIGATGKFLGTFDGQNHTIANLVVSEEGKTSVGLFANGRVIKNIKVVNAEISGHYKAGVIVGDGLCAQIENCHVENVKVVVTPINNDDGNNVGGIVGYLSAEPTAYVKDCSVKNAEITAYRKVGGIVGAANGASEVTGNYIESSYITADMTAEYKDDKPADAGKIIGWKHANAKAENNTYAGEKETVANALAVRVIVMPKADKIADCINNSEESIVMLPDGTYSFTADVEKDDNNNKTLQASGTNVTLDADGHTLNLGSAANYGLIANMGAEVVVNDADIVSGGGAIAAADGSKVTVNGGSAYVDSSSTSGRYIFYAYGEGTVITVNGGSYSWDPADNLKRAYVYCDAGAKVIINGGTFGKASTRSGYSDGIMGVGETIIYGGTFGFNPTRWVAEGCTVKKVGTNWVVMSPEVATAEELAARLQDNIKEINIVLTEDIDLPISSLGQQTGGSGEYKLGGEATEKITIDLNDKTLNITTTYWSAIGAKNNDALFTIKNGTMTSTGNSAGTWNAWDIRLSNCNYAIEDVTFEKAVALDNVGKTTYMKNVTITDNHNTDTYGLWITAEGQTVTLDGCVIDMTPASDGRGIKIDNQYVAAGSEEKVTLNVANTTFKTDEKAAILVKNPAGADIALENVNIANVAADSTFAVWVDEDAAAYADLVTVTGGLKKTEGSNSAVAAGSQSDFAAAVGNGETSTIVLTAGTYNMPSTGGKELTIIGNKDVIINAGASNMGDGNVTLEGVTITAGSYKGFQHSGVVTYNNVTIEGQLNCYGKEDIFNGCTFELDNAYVWTYGSKKTVFNGCTFNTNGKAILIYNEGAGACNVEVTDCTFNATAGAKAGAIANQNCAAIEIDNYAKMAHKLTTSGNTVDTDFSGEWRIKNYVEDAPVTVNGVEYTYIALDGKKMTIDGEKNVTVVE